MLRFRRTFHRNVFHSVIEAFALFILLHTSLLCFAEGFSVPYSRMPTSGFHHVNVGLRTDLLTDTTRRNVQNFKLMAERIEQMLGDEMVTHIDDEDECIVEGESCYLDHHEEEDEIGFLTSVPISKAQSENSLLNPVLIAPIITPILAYTTYDSVAKSFNTLFLLMSLDNSWIPVDGGAFQAKIIAPAINGIVVPCISILFATLMSNTVSTLRQRQLDIHTFLNIESGELRMLSTLVEAFPSSITKSRCREYLKQYTSRLIAECEDSTTSKSLYGSLDSEMNAFIGALNQLAIGDMYDDNDDHRSRKLSPPDTIISESYGTVARLNSIRSSRITALQSTFPTLHYMILGLLASSICLAFLLETNQELLIFLNAIQLRILWTMLIGSISALWVVCWDLSLPFTGSYVISNVVDQLRTIKDMIKATIDGDKDVLS